MKKANLELLLKRKQNREKNDTKDIDVAALGMTFTVQKLPLGQVLGIMDRYQGDESFSGKFDLFKELVYMSIPLFRNKELIEAYEVHEPHDVVVCVLEDNIGALTEIATAILEMYGLNNGQAVEEVKN